MEELRPSSGLTLGVLTLGGAAFGFHISPLTMNARAWTRSSLLELRDLSETRAIRKAKLVFMANYPLQRREDS
jgi:hypothetical protein